MTLTSSRARQGADPSTQRNAPSPTSLDLDIPSAPTTVTELDRFAAALQDWNAMARMQSVDPEGVSSRRRSPGMKAGMDFSSSSMCNEAHAATAALLMSLRLTSVDLERSLMLVNRQIARLQKEVGARRKVQMARAMEEAKALIARHGLNAKDLAEIEQGLRVGAAPVRTTPKNSKPVPAL